MVEWKVKWRYYQMESLGVHNVTVVLNFCFPEINKKNSYQMSNKADCGGNGDPLSGMHTPVHQHAGGSQNGIKHI